MKFVKSLILSATLIAVSSAATTYESFTVNDVTQSCDFNLVGGACTSVATCGSNKDTVYSYNIASVEGKENTFTINGYSGDKCDVTVAQTAEFVCDAGKAVTVTFENKNEVSVTCVAASSSSTKDSSSKDSSSKDSSSKDESSDASSTIAFTFGVLASTIVAALL